MRIAILSRNPMLYTTRRFSEAARRMGHDSIVLDPLHCVLRLDERPLVIHRGKTLDHVSVVLPRIGNSITEYGLAVVNQFELAGVATVNSAAGIGNSRDKLRCLQLLRRHDVPVPATVMLRSPEDIEPAVEIVGGTPVVLKLLHGTQGIGVMLVENLNSLRSIVQAMWGLGQNLLLQRYVHESGGRDIRALVVGDQVVGAMQRQAGAHEFRANLHRGGEGVPIEIPPDWAEVAVRASRVVGLRVSGVDLIESATGPQVLEINSSPGFEGLEKATRRDVARMILDHAFTLPEGVAP